MSWPGHSNIIMVKASNSMRNILPHSLAKNRMLTFWLSWLIVCTVGVHMRLFPLRHHTSDEVKEKASLLVISQLKQSVEQSVTTSFPQLNSAEKNLLIKKRFDELLRQNKNRVRKTIAQLSANMQKNLSTPEKFYLLASDSFYYLDLTQNILKTGHVSDRIKGSKYFNPKMTAPKGYWEPLNLHPYLGAALHSGISRCIPSISLMDSVSYIPLIIMCLSVLPFLWICRLWGCPFFVTLPSAFFLITAPIFLKRSMYGWYDNDPYSILFPLTILGLIFTGLKKMQQSQPWGKIAIAGGFTVSLYALFWQGWVFMESLLVAGGITSGLYAFFYRKEKNTARKVMYFYITMFTLSFTGVSVLFGWQEFFLLFKEGLKALRDFWNPSFALWPDLYLAVGELRKSTIPQIIELTGGFVTWSFAALGTGMTVGQLIRKKTDSSGDTLLLLIFLAFIIPMTLGAQRFALLCLVPIALLAAYGLNSTVIMLNEFLKKHLPPRQREPFVIKSIVAGLLIALTAGSVAFASRDIASLLNPIYNGTWEEALVYIRDHTPENSIINTWWSPGHFIKAIAQRRVTFDGATINKPQAYWLAKFFLSDDEKEALGTLRMLNGSANDAADYLLNTGMPLPEAVSLLNRVTAVDRQTAGDRLKDILTPQQQAQLLDLTHAPPPPSYLLITNELIESHILISFTGRWDFQKAAAVNQDKALRKKLPRYASKDYISFLWDMAGGYPHYSGILSPVAQDGEKVLFTDNVVCHLGKKECVVNSPVYGRGLPRFIHYVENGKIIEKAIPQGTLNYSVVLAKTPGGIQCALMDHYLARSLLMRLYFFPEADFKYITAFHQAKDLTGRTQIRTFKIDWEHYLRQNPE